MNPPAAGAGAAPPLNEEQVRQAVVFLSDERVKAADPARAVHFLRQKRIAERELREAFNRCGLPFPPDAPAGQLAAWAHAPGHYLGPPAPPPARSTWLGALWSLTAIVGACAVMREVFRRYVLPEFFPELAGGGSADVIRRQERQIGTFPLRARARSRQRRGA